MHSKLTIDKDHRPHRIAHLKTSPNGRQLCPGNGRIVATYCVHGHEVSQNVANALRQRRDAGSLSRRRYHPLEGAERLPTRRKRDATENKWVTREHPKIDRIACPWLISRFVNPDAEFIYVPLNDVSEVAKDVGGTPYDIKDVEFGHVGDRCSFDAIVKAYDVP